MFRWLRKNGTNSNSRNSTAAAESVESEIQQSEFDFAAWVSSTSHLVPLKATTRKVPNPNRARGPRQSFRTREQMREHGVTLALSEFYKLKQQYLDKKKTKRQTRGAMNALKSCLAPPAAAVLERRGVQLILDVGAWILMQGAPVFLTLMLFGCFSAYRSGMSMVLPVAASILLSLLTIISERRMRLLVREAEHKKAEDAASRSSTDAASGSLHSTPARGQAEDIHTVPWQHARGPRFKAEPRSRKQQEELKRRSRVQAGRGMRGVMGPEHCSAEELKPIRAGIAEVQAALYGEPAGGDFAARRMSLEEALLEVDRLVASVGIETSSSTSSESSSRTTAARRKLAELKKCLGI